MKSKKSDTSIQKDSNGMFFCVPGSGNDDGTIFEAKGVQLPKGSTRKVLKNCVYTDRLYQWDYKKHNALCRKHWGNEGQYWNSRSPASIEAFLIDWTSNPTLKLTCIKTGNNLSNGYPWWAFQYEYLDLEVIATDLISEAQADGKSIDTEALDDMVHDTAINDSLAQFINGTEEASQESAIDACERFASGINNEGPHAQVKYLLSQGIEEEYVRSALGLKAA